MARSMYNVLEEHLCQRWRVHVNNFVSFNSKWYTCGTRSWLHHQVWCHGYITMYTFHRLRLIITANSILITSWQKSVLWCNHDLISCDVIMPLSSINCSLLMTTCLFCLVMVDHGRRPGDSGELHLARYGHSCRKVRWYVCLYVHTCMYLYQYVYVGTSPSVGVWHLTILHFSCALLSFNIFKDVFARKTLLVDEKLFFPPCWWMGGKTALLRNYLMMMSYFNFGNTNISYQLYCLLE